ncbi:hypothetical protein GNF76_15485 [Pseudomonas sp. CCM 7893]|uniref:Uncharacterized protein n=1 Tax=Pseudomonas spelaei TaxID=1055469 RepID=A0A6I3WGV4_9PSED|nr:hypothetical protein [Pseudomonas spelaei]
MASCAFTYNMPIPFPAIEQHINQLLLTQAHRTQTLQVVALGAEAKHCDLTFRTDQRQDTHGAFRMLSSI